MRCRSSITALPWAVLLAALLGSSVATWQAARAASARAESRFREHAAETGAAMQAKLDQHQVLLRSAAGLFVASEHVTPEEFASFTGPVGITDEYQGIRSVGFAARVQRDRIPEFQQALSEHHQREINVWPPTEAAEVFSIAAVEPLDERKSITLGFDLASDPLRYSALEWAMATGQAAASGPIDIVEVTPIPRRGFLMVIPLFGDVDAGWERLLGGPARWPPPDDVQARTRDLRGFIIGVFIMQEIVAAVRERRPRTPLPLAIYDGPEFTDEALLYASPRAGEPHQATVTEELEVAGRMWTILFFDPRDTGGWMAWLGLGPRTVGESRLVPIIALLGIGFSIALFLVTRAQVHARSAAEEAADEAQRQRAIAAESERRFRTLADAAPVLIWMAGPDGGVVWVNLATLEFTGRPLEQLVREGWIAAVHEDDRRQASTGYHEAIRARRPFTQEFRMRRGDGEYRWVLITGRPVFRAAATGESAEKHAPGDKTGFAGYIGTGMDITDQRLAMERLHEQARELEAVNVHLERLNAELARSNAELSDFASIAAHDLKEPLRGMGNYARFIREDYGELLPAQGREMLETIERLGSRLGRLLDALMEYARVGRGELQLEETDLNEVCRQVKEGLGAQLAEPDIEVDCRPMPTLRCDPILVSQLISNLIINGLKYNTSIPRRVEVGSLASDDGPILYVRDNGIGIPSQHHDRIFKMFKRLHTREAYGGGLGSGLAIVKKIIERHDGHIWIASELQRGTTFYFTLSPQPQRLPVEAHAVHAG